MAHVMGYSENELAVCRLSDKHSLLKSRVQSLSHPWVKTLDGGWFLYDRRVIGDCWWGPDKAIPTDEVLGVPEDERHWISLADFVDENAELEREANRILKAEIPADVDDMAVAQLRDASTSAMRFVRAASTLLPTSRPSASTLGIVAFPVRGSRARAPRRRRASASGSRGSPSGSSDSDEPGPPKGGLRERILAYFRGGSS